MTADDARTAWGALASLAGFFSLIGCGASGSALRVALSRRGAGGLTGRLVVARDLWMLGLLTATGALGVATAGVLLALLQWYGTDLDAVLAHLAVPVLLAYAGYAAQTAIVTMVAPIWLIARWRALDRSERQEGC